MKADRTTYSEGLEELYGDYVVDLLARDRERLLALTHPEDQQRLLKLLQQLVGGAEQAVDVEVRQRGRNGWMWVRLRALGTYGPDGALVEASGTYQDITRARDTEDQLQDLVTQNSLMQAVATAANEATTLDEVLSQARSLVVLHDDSGPRPRLRALRRRLGADTAPRGGGAGGVARCGRRRGRRHRAGDRRGALPPRRVRLGRRAPTHARLRHPPAGRDPGGDHHHLTAAAVPARHDPGDGRGRRGPALPGRGSRASRAAAGRRARPRRAGIAPSPTSWPP